jgi:hypothetical protein
MPTLAELGITDRQSSDWQAIIGRLTDLSWKNVSGEFAAGPVARSRRTRPFAGRSADPR